MIGNLFDSPWKILLVAVVLIVLFGSKKLPHAARSLGQSMRILKREVQSLHEDENESPAQDGTSAPQLPQAQRTAAPSESAQGATAPADQQSQIDALQQQIRDLQRSAPADTPVGPGSAAEPQGPSSPARLGFLLDSVMAKLPGATQDARIVGERYVRSQQRANLEGRAGSVAPNGRYKAMNRSSWRHGPATSGRTARRCLISSCSLQVIDS